jgi:hypothetical protein
MEKYLLVLLLLPLFALTGCVKQKNCDCAHVQKGKFIYMEEPEKHGYYNVTALFIPDPYFGFHKEGLDTHEIIGTIPKDYQGMDTVYVNVCLHEIVTGRKLQTHLYYKPGCIEKES